MGNFQDAFFVLAGLCIGAVGAEAQSPANSTTSLTLNLTSAMQAVSEEIEEQNQALEKAEQNLIDQGATNAQFRSK